MRRARAPQRPAALATYVVGLVMSLAIAGAGMACENDSPAAAPAAPTVHNYVLQVEGMHCDACSDAITAKVSTMPGVQSVDVNHESGRAQVQVQGDETKESALVEAIDKLGFEASVTSPTAPTPAS